MEHSQVYKVVMEPEGCNQAQEVKSPFPAWTGSITDKWVSPYIINRSMLIIIIIIVPLKISTHREDGVTISQ